MLLLFWNLTNFASYPVSAGIAIFSEENHMFVFLKYLKYEIH